MQQEKFKSPLRADNPLHTPTENLSPVLKALLQKITSLESLDNRITLLQVYNIFLGEKFSHRHIISYNLFEHVQKGDSELHHELLDTILKLQVKLKGIDQESLLCDTSTGRNRLIVPEHNGRNVFNTLHEHAR